MGLLTARPHLSAPHSPQAASSYRADIDGLRALAIALVVVFHAFPTALPGGFVGVDVFLVMSGYLVTASLSHETGREFWHFYPRRARRLVPTLMVVLAACLILGWVLMLPGEFQQLGKHVAGGAAFVDNIVLYTEAGYFDAGSETKPLLHLWYLGVDAQFCLVWPLALMLVRRWCRRIFWAMAALLLASFAVNLFQVGHDPSGAYFLPLSRLWELMIGAILAVWRPARPVETRKVRDGIAWTGLALVIAAALTLSQSKSYPGWWALLPTLGTAGLILAGPQAWLNRRVFAHPLMVGMGAISYPLYLWHLPLLTMLRLQTEGAPSPGMVGLVIAVSFALAWATRQGVERPLHGRWRGKVADRIMAGGLAACALAGLGVAASGGVPQRMPLIARYDAVYANQNYGEAHDLFHQDRQECNFYDVRHNSGKTAIDPSCYVPKTDTVVLVWGDSHSQHLQHGLRAALPPEVSLLQVAASGCIPSLTVQDDDPIGACNRANAFAIERIKALRPAVVLLAQEGHHEDNDFPALVARLHQLGVGHVILPGPVPHWKPFLYQVVERKYRGQPPRRTWDNLQPGALHTDKWLRERFAGSTEVTYISLIGQLCDAEGCLVYLGDDPLTGLTTYDYGHFTLPMSDYVASTLLAPAILKALGE